ncbi:MAG: peptidoglycan DD-metalloendopeptidase family protein [Elusimicrobiota bacterium]
MLRVLILAALAAVLAVPACAQAKQKKELARIQSELRRTLAELEELKGAEKDLGRDVSRLKSQDADSSRRVEHLQANIRQAEQRRAELKARLESSRQVVGFWTAALSAEAARHAATGAGSSDFRGSSQLWADEFRRAAIFEKAGHLRGLQGFKRKTEADEVAVRRRATELSKTRRKAQTEREGRRLEYEAKKAELEKAQVKIAASARRAKDLEESAKAMNALLDRIAQAGRWRKTGPVATLEIAKHSLPWPMEGKVLRGFGREKDAELGTWTVHQGILIASDIPAAVAAVSAGRVIFAGPFRSYGRVVILDHGGGFLSVYGGLGEILKTKGSDVRAGETIAHGGDSQDGPGGRVYLEIRRGTQALDPRAWLRQR